MTADQYESRIEALTAALETASDFLDRYADVEDGPDGPEPNTAMSLMSYINRVLES